ncbi:ABC transporter ATP-binding protein [Tenggerimyces flavus]|uniref:ABC transporter ATP-binding protein n=1 Tax=Tenggerimyces flavus TaxID=1708749 RepID=A0ABV7YE84_9ACTN|nr:ABC transporter ATP-binding protein [Tenggerimyces flavus]MBM7786971.1 putative ABC transport system ATP-binding protein [Tenggerimyces flavus]
MTARLVGRELSLAFGATTALDDLSIDIQAGEIVAVMGPSGSGKSTLLHCLAGILRPDGGEVLFEDRSVTGLSEGARSALRLRSFGFVFQFSDLLPELTLRENVVLPLQLNRSPRDAMRKASGLLEALEIDDIAGRRPAEVSGGQVQRAAVARALVHEPSVVFADEPTGALDSVAGELVLTALIKLARSNGASVVLVTHDHRVAAHADREVILRDGRVAA